MVAKAKSKGLVRRMFGRLCSSLGIAHTSRKVRFQNATIYEFERQLLGGGGVPDGDTVALGLGPRCASLIPQMTRLQRSLCSHDRYATRAQPTSLVRSTHSTAHLPGLCMKRALACTEQPAWPTGRPR